MKSLAVYVASKFEQKELVRRVHHMLRERGHRITMDWTIHDAGSRTGRELADYLTMCADQDEQGVRDADVLFLIDHPNCKGAYTELGIAIGCYKHIIIIGGVESPLRGMKQNIFHHKGSIVHLEEVADGLDHVDLLAEHIIEAA